MKLVLTPLVVLALVAAAAGGDYIPGRTPNTPYGGGCPCSNPNTGRQECYCSDPRHKCPNHCDCETSLAAKAVAMQYVSVAAVESIDAKIARLKAELAQLRGETAQVATPVIARGHWETRCNGLNCTRVWVADAGFVGAPLPPVSATVTATVSSGCPTMAAHAGPVRAFFAARPVRSWFANRPRLFGGCP